jgi:RNA polymerase sigma-70 factor, ECF subfamily
MTEHNGSANQFMIAFQGGDEGAFDQLYMLLKSPLYAFLFRFTKEEQFSIDLVQDAFLKLHQSKSSFDPKKAGVKTYLFQIAYHLMITKLNRRKKWRKLLPFLLPSSQGQMDQAEKMTIREAIARLPEAQRAVIILSYYHDMPQAEIAEVVNIPVGTVKSRLHHAIRTLRTFLEVDDIEQRKTQ